MSMNYYAKPRVGIRKIKQLEKILRDNGFSTDIARSALNDSKVHLGTEAFGWRFLFNHNNWRHFKKSKKSVQEFTKRYLIEDNYGNKVSYLKFWKMIESCEKGSFNNGVHCEVYDGLWFATNFS